MTETVTKGLISTIDEVVYEDKWMWIADWGPQRTGKSTLAMDVAYSFYRDWDLVLDSFVFTLPQLIYKLDSGRPIKKWTRNGLHNRIPLLIWDDFAAHNNKAIILSDPAWNSFKGGFDALGTKVAVIIATMVKPDSATVQLLEKFTHELYVFARGWYKFDEVEWQQNYGGWRSVEKKDWIETNQFYRVPLEIEKRYNEIRESLADEVIQKIRDRFAEDEIPRILRLMNQEDVKVLEALRSLGGQVTYDSWREKSGVQDGFQESLVRLKARDLVIPMRRKEYYVYDITDLGLDVLDSLRGKYVGTTSPIETSGYLTPSGTVIAETYPQKLEQRREVLQQFREHDTILEMFAGQGTLSEQVYLNNCRRLILVDANQSYLGLADGKLREKGFPYEIFCMDNIKWINSVLALRVGEFQDKLTLVDFDDFGMPGETIQAFFKVFRVKKPLLVSVTDGGSHKLGFQSKELGQLLSKHYGMEISYTRDKQVLLLDQLMDRVASEQRCSCKRINWSQNPQNTVVYAGYLLEPASG